MSSPPPVSHGVEPSTTVSSSTTATAVPDAILVSSAEPSGPPGIMTPCCRLPLSPAMLTVLGTLLGLCILFPVAVAAGSARVIALLTLLPAALFVVFVHRRGISPQQTFARFALGWVALMPVSAAAWLTGLVAISFFFGIIRSLVGGSFDAAHVKLILSFQLLASALTIAAAEECFKMLTLTTVDRVEALAEPHHYPHYSTATALGSSIALAYYAVLLVTWEQSTFAEVFLVAIICSLLLVPMQCLSSYHIGLAVARVRYLKQEGVSLQLVVLIAIAFRGVFLYALFESIYIGVWSLAICAVVTAIYIVVIKRYERGMPRAYLAKTGTLSLFGYGALATDEGEVEAQHNAADDEDDDAPPSTVQ